MTTEDAAENDPLANDKAKLIEYIRNSDGAIVAECWEISVNLGPSALYVYEYWTYFTSDRWFTFPEGRKITYRSSTRLIQLRAREMNECSYYIK